jgi:type I restriction enzyme M protein
MVVSNPPYSVPAFKQNARNYYTEKDFELYEKLTDNSSEIECLFIERTKQLLKDGGMAGIILPSSILSNTGIYTKTREIILLNFDIVAIAELGSNTFMATGTNTVTLFLRRRNNYNSINLKKSVEKFFTNIQDVTLNGLEKPVAKYIAHVWEDISFEDYKTLLEKQPNEAIKQHEIFLEYQKKIKTKKAQDKWNEILKLEEEKLLYFIISYSQKLVLVKSGQKKAEKQFLGYEFSNRRGNEGIHSIQGGKAIDECTSLFDTEVFDNPEKASTYVYKAFQGNFDYPIAESLKNNISRLNLVDMLTFDRVDFEKNISLSVKKKVKIESQWDIFKLSQLMTIVRGASPRPIRDFITNNENGVNWIKIGDISTESKYITSTKEKITVEGSLKSRQVKKGDFILSNSMSFGRPYIMNTTGCIHDGWLLLTDYENSLDKDYLYNILSNSIVQEQFISLASGGTTVDNLNIERVSSVKIPLPPKDIQQKIVTAIEVLEKQEAKRIEKIEKNKEKIKTLLQTDKKVPLKSLLVTINPNKTETINDLSNDTNVSFLSMPDVSNDGEITNLQKRRLIDVKTGFTFFQKDDVLFAKITPCMENGKGALVSDLENNVGFGSTEFLVLRANKMKLLPKILFYHIQSKEFRSKAEKEMTGASGHRRVPKPFVENYQIPLFSLSEQQKIVSQIEKIEKEIAKLEDEIASIPKQKNKVLEKHLK